MVDVHQRINARKFVLSYLYQYCFYSTFQASLDHLANEEKNEETKENSPFL
jgi:hypothetical protein